MFDRPVELEDKVILRRLAENDAQALVVGAFRDAIRALSIIEREPTIEENALRVSDTPPFPWSRKTVEGKRTIFNLTPVDSSLEARFAEFLDRATDVTAWAKLTMNSRFALEYISTRVRCAYHYPDFVLRLADDTCLIVETKGQEDLDVALKIGAPAAGAGTPRASPDATGPTRRCPRSSSTASTAIAWRPCAGSWMRAAQVVELAKLRRDSCRLVVSSIWDAIVARSMTSDQGTQIDLSAWAQELDEERARLEKANESQLPAATSCSPPIPSAPPTSPATAKCSRLEAKTPGEATAKVRPLAAGRRLRTYLATGTYRDELAEARWVA